MLQIYNTKTQSKQLFKPIIPGKVSLYTCGVTVYDYCHIGHARTFIAFDVIVRYLRYRGFNVEYVRNVTDIDDKIINKAQQCGEPISAITERFIAAQQTDFNALQLLPPNHEPRATEFIPQMIALVQKLIANGIAYLADNGDVYFNVRKWKNYGSLSKRNLDDLQHGARVEVNAAKQDPLDFVLWKKAKPGEPTWPSPWGEGRPGWHLECSAMAMHYFGDTLDLHGGGFDLMFPHHENECAQSEAATDQPFVNTWMHVGFLNINKEKMSKSLNNFFTIKDVLQEVHPEILRYAMTSAHYRSHIEYSAEQLALSKAALEKFYLALRNLPTHGVAPTNSEYEQRFIAAMDDDFNTPEAFAVLFDLTKEINRLNKSSNQEHIQENPASELGALLKKLGQILGILYCEPEYFLQHLSLHKSIDVDKIEEMIALRNHARKSHDWLTADRIRNELDALGVVIEDSAGNTTWRKK